MREPLFTSRFSRLFLVPFHDVQASCIALGGIDDAPFVNVEIVHLGGWLSSRSWRDAKGLELRPVGVSDIVNFSLQSLEIPLGTTITWTNQDGPAHTTTSAGLAEVPWDSGRLRTGQEFSFTFNTAGTLAYLCTIHPSMTGTITVTQ